MGFGSFFKHLTKVTPESLLTFGFGPTVEKALHIGPVGTQLVSGFAGLFQSHHGGGTTTIVQSGQNVPQPTDRFYPDQPYGYYGAGGYDYPPLDYGGTAPWDYSTPLVPSSIQPYRTYQVSSPPAPAQADRSWEDLILGSALFL